MMGDVADNIPGLPGVGENCKEIPGRIWFGYLK
jgi:hypothetical protein